MISTPTMRNAMRSAAARTGSSDRTLTVHTLEALAAAVLAHTPLTDHMIVHLEDVSREAWGHEIKREKLRASMRRIIAVKVLDEERLPTALPTERLTYWQGFGPNAIDVGETGEWQYVRVELSVPTRKANA